MTRSPDLLDRFRRAQRTTRACLLEVEGELHPGLTERDAADRIERAVEAAGAQGFFHRPLVWSGARTSLAGLASRAEFFPSTRRLRRGDVVILDVAPIFDGCVADVSRTFSLGACRAMSDARAVQRRLRDAVPKLVSGGATGRDVSREVARLAAEAGFDNPQSAYLFGALAHRVYRLPASRWSMRSVAGVGLPSAVRLFGSALAATLPFADVEWPFWSDSPRADRRPGAGLWSVEPHLARDGLGFKWEELLLVTEQGTDWLDPEGDPF